MEMVGENTKENDFKEEFVKTNAQLLHTLGKLTNAEHEIQSLENERKALEEDNAILRNSRSGISKERKNHEDTISTMEKERQQLKNRIEELEIEVEALKKEVKDLEETISNIKAVECASDEAGRVSLMVETVHTRRLIKENADLLEQTEAVTKEKEKYKKENKQLQEERENFRSIIRMFQETRMESDTAFFRNLYTGKLKIDGISVDDVLGFAGTYGTRETVKLVVARQLESMDAETFCSFVRENEQHMTDIIKGKCHEYVFNEPLKVFQSGTFEVLPRSFLQEILESEMLVLDEEVICTAVLLWARKECEAALLEINGENQRKVLAEMFHLIRFPLLSLAYFTENISEKSLLTEREEVQMLLYFLKAKNAHHNLKFETKTRAIPKIPFKFSQEDENSIYISMTSGSRPILASSETEKQGYVSRFTQRGISWGYRGNRKDAIAFTVSRDIVLRYIDIYGTCKENGNLDVGVVLRENTKKVSETGMKVPCSITNSSNLYEVWIENETRSCGVHIKAGIEYHIILTINGKNTFYGKNGTAKVISDGVEFNFRNSQYSTNNTNTNIGQIVGLKFTIV